MPMDDNSIRDILRPGSLIQRIRALFTFKKRKQQLKTLETVLRKDLARLRLSIEDGLFKALKDAEEMQRLINEAKPCLNQLKEEYPQILHAIKKEAPGGEVLTQEKLDYILEYYSGLKLMTEIIIESKAQEGFLRKINEFVCWLGFKGPSLTLYAEEEMIAHRRWKSLIIKSAQSMPWDDMPPEIRRRHLGLKGLFEDSGGKFSYTVTPSQGTELILKMPFRLPSSATKYIRVLYVDDDKEYVDSFRKFLRDFRGNVPGPTAHLLLDAVYDISWAPHAASALAALEKQDPHIAIVKVIAKEPYSYASLKNDKGIKLINRIKELHSNVQYIAHMVCEQPQPRLYYLLKEFGIDYSLCKMPRYEHLVQQLRLVVWEHHLGE